MSRAKVRARNMSRLLDNLGKNGVLTVRSMELQMPQVVGIRWRYTGERMSIGDTPMQTKEGVMYATYPACTRVQVHGRGHVYLRAMFYFRGYGSREVRASGMDLIAFPVPMPAGWKYPDAAARLTNMSRVGNFGDEKAPPGEW